MLLQDTQDWKADETANGPRLEFDEECGGCKSDSSDKHAHNETGPARDEPWFCCRLSGVMSLYSARALGVERRR